MENKTIVQPTLEKALEELHELLLDNVEASIEYFNTLLDGEPAHTFKINYT